MLRAKRGLAVLVALGTLAVGTLAVASGERRPDTDTVMTTIVFEDVVGKERFCDGVDGPYAEQYVRVTGTATGDSRLSGNVEFSVYLIVNIDNGVGIEDGTIRITDPATGRTKVKARVKDSGVAEIWQGLLFGEVRARGMGGEETSGAGRIHANYRTTFHPNGAIVMQVGGEAADGRIPGVIFSGRCKGKFERFEGEIPPPPATTTARTRAVASKVGWNR
jgi:hypothetical protein